MKLLCFLAVLLLSRSLDAATYYVDATGGNDSNAGSIASPWQTVAKVNASTFAPNDFILFKRGELWRETLTIPSSGTAGNPITFGDYGTGTKPTLYGSSTVPAPATPGWTLSSGSIYYTTWTTASNNVFQSNTPLLKKDSTGAMTAGTFFADTGASRLYVWTTTGADPSGFTMEASTNGPQYYGIIRGLNKDNITIQNFLIKKTNYSGVYCSECDNLIVRWNDFEQTFQNTITVLGNLQEANSTNVVVTGNTLLNSGTGRGLTGGLESECVGINAQGWQTGEVSNNTITNQGGEGIQVLAGATNVTVTRNTVVNPYVTGIYSGAGFGNGGHVTGTVVSYNYVELGAASISPAYTISTEHALSPATVVAGTDLFTALYDFSYINLYPVRFSTTGTLPAPLVAGTVYYLRDVSGATFKLATTSGGSVLDITTTGTGTHTVEISHRVDGVNFHHNIAKGNGSAIAGLLFGSGLYLGTIRNAKVHHNVFVNDQYGIKAAGPTDDTSNVFSNNIISGLGFARLYWIKSNPTLGVNPHTNYNIDYDVIYSPQLATLAVQLTDSGGTDTYPTLAGWRTATAHADNTVAVDPLFVNIASDWTLQRTSPAINAGILISGVGQSRQGSAPDMGAYEYAPGKLGTLANTKLRNRYKGTVYP